MRIEAVYCISMQGNEQYTLGYYFLRKYYMVAITKSGIGETEMLKWGLISCWCYGACIGDLSKRSSRRLHQTGQK